MPAESGEESHSPGLTGSQSRALPAADPLDQPLAFLGGATIALITLLVPLASVMVERGSLQSGDTMPVEPALQSDRSGQSRAVTARTAPQRL